MELNTYFPFRLIYKYKTMNFINNDTTKLPSNHHRIHECTELITSEIIGGSNGTALIIVYIVSMFFIVISNMMFIFGLFRTKTKQLFSTQLIFLVISCSDLLAGLVFVPFQLYFIVHIPDVSCNLSINRAFWSTFPITFSGCLIMFLTIDRYSVVSKTTTRLARANVNDRLVIVYIVISLMASLSWSAWHAGITFTEPRDIITTNRRMAAFFVSIASFEFVVLGVSLIYNMLIVRTVKKNNEQSTVSNAMKRKAEHKLSKTILIIGTSLILTYSPSVFATYTIGVTLQELERSQLLEKRALLVQITRALLWALILTLINSGLNAVIFITRNSRIRRMFCSMYDRKVRWREHVDMGSLSSIRVTPTDTPSIIRVPMVQQ